MTSRSDVAALAMDKCIETGPEGASPEDDNFWVEFNYEFLDDTYSYWGAEEGADNLAFQGRLLVQTLKLKCWYLTYFFISPLVCYYTNTGSDTQSLGTLNIGTSVHVIFVQPEIFILT